MIQTDSEDEFDPIMSDSEVSDLDFDDENDENYNYNNKKSTVKAAEKKKNPPNSKNNSNFNTASKFTGAKKTVEETYQKKTQLEHILLRPDTYIGSTEPLTQPMFVLNSETDRIHQRDITFTPGLYKIFDEIVVNAADNKQRDPNMDRMEVIVDAETNTISVLNNGKGIPVVMHKEHNCYVPTLIFGHLLTGSNFDDDEKKTTGGRNGYGAKLANIFSTEFIVECLDAEQGLKFTQVFRNNMHKAEDPKVKKCSTAEKKKGDYTKITFKPDLERFHMSCLDADTVGLLSKRAYDIAGSMANKEGKKLSVYLNGKKLPVKDFKSYLSLFDDKDIESPSAYEKVGDRWEVGVSTSDSGSLKQISFVNAIATTKGGTHVNCIVDQVAKHLSAIIKKKNKGGAEIKLAQIKNHLTVFVNCLIENPTFDSQTKENLTTQSKNFKSDAKVSDKFLKQVEKCGVVDSILSFAKFKQNQQLKRKGGAKRNKLTGITKLDDANHAGTAKSKDCTLIITEGDSAKSLAVSGISVVGRDYYGVFPLKGKPLNVRDATHAQIMKNEEIMNVVEIMGLKFGTEYTEENIKTLRYGHLMIMADQDHDGSHIKGLVINFIHHFWPSLLDIPGFLLQFITPIVKCTKGKKTKTFFTLPEYEEWKKSTGNEGKGWHIKYYKGLGTSTSSEAKEYFSNLDTHKIHFKSLSSDVLSPPPSVESDDENEDMEFTEVSKPVAFISTGAGLIEMAFSKSKVAERKHWLNNVEKDTFLNYKAAQGRGLNYSDFINRELVLFSQYDNVRSIPHIMDGFKPSQRKVLFACFKKKLKNEIKVAQLAGYIGEHSAYHHGDMSLTGTIIGMAQSFCGSNNINLLYPSGQFGTRRMGGKDHASARYIFTRLEKIARTVFHPDDDPLLNYLNDDGLSIEPEYYMPVIPMVLVNGSDGIGTGWSSTIQNHNPRDIIENIRKMINREEPEDMHPYFNGFDGEIIPETGSRDGSYIVKGRIERLNDTTLVISELPVGKWTQDYKAFLEKLVCSEKGPSEIDDFKENHTDTTVSFTVTAQKKAIDDFENTKDGLHGKFKLSATLSTKNMTAFDFDGKIHKYKTSLDILRQFFGHRLKFYVKRKAMLLYKLKKELKILENKARFVEEVCKGDLVVGNRKRSVLLSELQSKGFDLFPKDEKDESEDEDEEDSAEETKDGDDLAKGYEYLLGMKIWTLTFERAEQLRKEREEKAVGVEKLETTSPETIWLSDLDAIEEALDERDAALDEELKDERKAAKKGARRTAAAAKKEAKKKKSKKSDTWDSALESSEPSESEVEESDSEIEEVISKKKRSAPNRKESSSIKNESSSESRTTGFSRNVVKSSKKFKEIEAASIFGELARRRQAQNSNILRDYSDEMSQGDTDDRDFSNSYETSKPRTSNNNFKTDLKAAVATDVHSSKKGTVHKKRIINLSDSDFDELSTTTKAVPMDSTLTGNYESNLIMSQVESDDDDFPNSSDKSKTKSSKTRGKSNQKTPNPTANGESTIRYGFFSKKKEVLDLSDSNIDETSLAMEVESIESPLTGLNDKSKPRLSNSRGKTNRKTADSTTSRKSMTGKKKRIKKQNDALQLFDSDIDKASSVSSMCSSSTEQRKKASKSKAYGSKVRTEFVPRRKSTRKSYHLDSVEGDGVDSDESEVRDVKNEEKKANRLSRRTTKSVSATKTQLKKLVNKKKRSNKTGVSNIDDSVDERSRTDERSESGTEFEPANDEEFVPLPAPGRRARRARKGRTTKVNYVVDADSESEAVDIESSDYEF